MSCGSRDPTQVSPPEGPLASHCSHRRAPAKNRPRPGSSGASAAGPANAILCGLGAPCQLPTFRPEGARPLGSGQLQAVLSRSALLGQRCPRGGPARTQEPARRGSRGQTWAVGHQGNWKCKTASERHGKACVYTDANGKTCKWDERRALPEQHSYR